MNKKGMIAACFCLLFLASCLVGKTIPKNWNQFLGIVKNLSMTDMNDQKQQKAYSDSYRLLHFDENDPDDRCAWNFSPNLIVAQGDKKTVEIKNDLINNKSLICAGDINGDGKPEFIWGRGWFGPFGGQIRIYDENIRFLGKIKTSNLYKIQLKDMTGDGRDEILVWDQLHQPTQFDIVVFEIYRYVPEEGFRCILPSTGGLFDCGISIWEDAITGGHNSELSFRKEKNGTVSIQNKYTQFISRGATCWTDSHPNRTDIYTWDSKNGMYVRP